MNKYHRHVTWVGFEPTNLAILEQCLIFFYRTWESTQYTVQTHIGSLWVKKINIYILYPRCKFNISYYITPKQILAIWLDDCPSRVINVSVTWYCWKMECSIQLSSASLNRTFHLSTHEHIRTIALINIHYLYNISLFITILLDWNLLLFSVFFSPLNYLPERNLNGFVRLESGKLVWCLRRDVVASNVSELKRIVWMHSPYASLEGSTSLWPKDPF